MQDYSDERIQFVLSRMGISADQLDKIRLDLIRMRCMPLKNLDDAEKKIQYYVKSDYPLVITQKDIDSSRLCYHDVDYYVNFTDPMFLSDYSREIASLLSFLISEKADLGKVDRLVIPHDSNFLLGLEVGKRLGKPVAKMRYEKGKVLTDQLWEGEIRQTDRVIIVHDVLVRADQVIHAIRHLPSTCTILGVFCLIARKEWGGEARVVAETGVPVEAIARLDDSDIEAIREAI